MAIGSSPTVVSNVAWYLGPDHGGIRDEIVALEHYNAHVLGGGPAWRASFIAAVATLILGSPLLLFKAAGVAVLLGLVLVTNRAVRRLGRKPNDLLIALTTTRVYVFDAVST